VRNPPASGADRTPAVTNIVQSALAWSSDAPDGLDWRRFCEAYSPGSRRRDFEAIAAYAGYERSRAVAPSPDVQARNGLTGSAALQDREDEGGGTLSPTWPTRPKRCLETEREQRRRTILPLLLKLRRRQLAMEHPARLCNGRPGRIRLAEERCEVGHGG
jgi:hypothetical protein